jgi:predicted pyridoxine 5'-phosphate oxidase superfamily flavin-nucleotide-binding protein
LEYWRLQPFLTDTVKKFIKERFDQEYNGSVGVLSSLRVDGTPNASPKHFRIRDDEQLEFTDVFSQTLGDVLKKTPQVTVVFFDPQAVIGYRIRGKAELETFGPLFSQAANQLQNLGFKPKAVVSIRVEEVQALQYGPNTGKVIS